MTKSAGASRGLVFLALAACMGLAAAQDARISAFDKYNHAATYDEIKPVVSGVLAQQYALLASRAGQQFSQVLNQQQLTSYSPRLVDVDNATSFLVVDSGTSKSGRDVRSQAYLLSKNADGNWTVANRFMSDSIVRTLWTERFAPAEFVQPSMCSIDGKDIKPQSVLAVRDKDTIVMTLYQFKLSTADLDYWKQVSGMPVDDRALVGNHFNGDKTIVCRVTLRMATNNHVSLFNVGFEDHTGTVTRSQVWQAPQSDIVSLTIGNNRIALSTAGTFGTDKNGISWNVKIDVPVWVKGL